LKVSGADVVGLTEGNMDGRVIARVRPARRGQRNWHVQKLVAREPDFLPIVKGESGGAVTPPSGPGDLEAWIAQAGKSLVASFANGIVRDCAAVRVAIVEPWSNG
jgi:hypothetical protein